MLRLALSDCSHLECLLADHSSLYVQLGYPLPEVYSRQRLGSQSCSKRLGKELEAELLELASLEGSLHRDKSCPMSNPSVWQLV